MNSVEAIKKALPIFLQYHNLDDEDLLEIFIKEGIEPDTARKIVVFMPMAFGRVIINELTVNVSDEYECYQKKGVFTDKQRRKLNDVEIYRESFKIASKMAGRQDETFWAVAGRSAELNAVNQLKSQGSKPQNIVLTPMLTMWEIDEEPAQRKPKSTQTNNTEPAQTKNWWEFWK